MLGKNYGPYSWIEFKYLRGVEPLQGDSSLLTTTSPVILEIHFIDLGRMKDLVNLGGTY